jgi:DNA repair photolyase
MFAIVEHMALRWTTAESEEGGRLFPDEQVAERHVGKGAYAGMEFLHVNARTIINTVPPESRMPFRHTINAYRGCSHACVYCFARPTHDYLGLGIGTDFERKIVVKVNAVERLRAELRSPKWNGEHIAMGTNTDPYQHAEGKYHLTRGVVETLSGARNPFSILTKSTLILRDAALLAAAAERTDVGVSFSIGTLDRDVWKATEPGTPPPDRRVDAVRRLTDLGIRCGVLVAPVLPGLSDREDQLQEVVEACAAAGAVSVTGVALHLRGPMRAHYLEWLEGFRPDLVGVHRVRFRRGAYQPDDERSRIEGVVREAALRCGVTGRDRYRGVRSRATGHVPAPADAPVANPGGEAGGEQLSLLEDCTAATARDLPTLGRTYGASDHHRPPR